MSGIADTAVMVHTPLSSTASSRQHCVFFRLLDDQETWLTSLPTATGSEPAHGVGHNVPPTSTSSNYGPHDTNTGNKLDPRFDSDMDHRNNPTSAMGPSGGNVGSTNAGHHNSNLANKLDPRVDSDQDHRANPASNIGIQGAGAGGVGGVGSTNAGPHASNVGNKLDPRIDSDMDNRGNPASHIGGTGAGYR
jgi:hypothetical protein